jgi:hypothetical protein
MAWDGALPESTWVQQRPGPLVSVVGVIATRRCTGQTHCRLPRESPWVTPPYGHVAGTTWLLGCRRPEPRSGLLLEDRADEGALACLEYVRIPQRDPEAL